MAQIDLSLAINYLPALSCLLKTVLMASTLSVMHSAHMFGGATLFALSLNVDRIITGERIFNGNAILCMILFSWLLNYLRLGIQGDPGAAGLVLSIWWQMMSMCLLMEPQRLRGMLALDSAGQGGGSWSAPARIHVDPSKWQFQRAVPTVLNSIGIGLIAFMRADAESASFKIGRSVVFAVLCITWVYVVGVWQRCGASHQPFYTQNMLSRFCPVLFVEPALAVLFVMMSLGGLVYLYIDLHAGGVDRLGLTGSGSSLLCCCGGCGVGGGGGGGDEHASQSNLKAENLKEDAPLQQRRAGSHGSESLDDDDSEVGYCCDDSGYGSESFGPRSAPYGLSGGFLGPGGGGLEIGTIREEEDGDEDLEACFRAACQGRGQGQGQGHGEG